jgi:hypothetical protein
MESRYTDDRIVNQVNSLCTYIEGTDGAIAATIFALVALALIVRWGSTRRGTDLFGALLFLALAALIFLLRSLMASFFNDTGLRS